MFYERSYEKRGSYNHNRLGKQLLRFDGLADGADLLITGKGSPMLRH